MEDGLFYEINADGKSVTVIYQNNSTPRYTDLSGELNIPESVTCEGIPRHRDWLACVRGVQRFDFRDNTRIRRLGWRLFF